jgi:hypothetical protein
MRLPARPFWLWFVCLIVSALGSITFAADADWSVGVASVKTTPTKPVILAGYAARTKPHESVDLDLYAKALIIRDRKGSQAVLLTVDLCILPRDVAEPVQKRVAEHAKIDPAAVIISVSHSHSAPAAALAETDIGASTKPVNPTSPNNIEYTQWLQEQLVAVADKALADMKPAKLSWGTGVASFVMNRRQFTDKGVILGVNPRGLVDRSVPVLRIDGEDGKPRAILFGYACHLTTNPSNSLAVSSDYAGYARQHVQQKYPGVEALFMAGCGGDANPYPRQKPTDAAANGDTLGAEVCRILETKLTPIAGPLKCAAVQAELPLANPDRSEIERIAKTGPGVWKETAQKMLATLDAGKKLPATHTAPVAAWQFGKDLTLVALPDEVVVNYVQRLEEAVGPLRLWVAGYCHEVAGYIPTKRILQEGGYETRGLYLGVGWFAPEVEDALTNAAKEAAIKAGRPAN